MIIASVHIGDRLRFLLMFMLTCLLHRRRRSNCHFCCSFFWSYCRRFRRRFWTLSVSGSAFHVILRFLSRRKAFIRSPGITVHLLFALIPGQINPRNSPVLYRVKLFFRHCPLLIVSKLPLQTADIVLFPCLIHFVMPSAAVPSALPPDNPENPPIPHRLYR